MTLFSSRSSIEMSVFAGDALLDLSRDGAGEFATSESGEVSGLKWIFLEGDGLSYGVDVSSWLSAFNFAAPSVKSESVNWRSSELYTRELVWRDASNFQRACEPTTWKTDLHV